MIVLGTYIGFGKDVFLLTFLYCCLDFVTENLPFGSLVEKSSIGGGLDFLTSDLGASIDCSCFYFCRI